MAQLTLPKNSTIRVGKTWPKPEGATNTRKVQIYRWSPDDGENPRVDTYFRRHGYLRGRWFLGRADQDQETRSTRR